MGLNRMCTMYILEIRSVGDKQIEAIDPSLPSFDTILVIVIIHVGKFKNVKCGKQVMRQALRALLGLTVK